MSLEPRRAARLLLTAARNIGTLRREGLRASADAIGVSSKDETPLHKAADAHYKKILVAVRYAFAMGRKALGKPPDAAKAAQAVRDALGAVLGPTLLKVLVAGGEVGVALLGKRLRAAELRTAKGPQDPPLKMRFDATNEAAAAWAREHAAELAKDLSATTEQAIRDAVAAAQEEGDLGEQYDAILAAIGDEDRAQLIARTESMAAANEGQREAWDQAVEKGLLTGDERRVWIATSDACPECEELDGEEADLDGEYPGDGDDGPPLHPACRCVEGLVG